ncbi:nuclear receptor-interacting protein 2 isoform X2 [Brachyhypopomus gauderio]|uniref:nuclear receptor-interacting protein 2 isoform X2 n=1 Tax=Brachyhypopomus gauderio TaxID=698409 RepID=UPI0040413CC1
MSEPKKGETDLRDKAIMHQQRRLKQATQFSHKDSADLLPLDGLKRLGTSKDLQPHSIVQRRLLEGNRLRVEARDALALVRSPLVDSKDGGETEERSESTVDDSTEEQESPEESEKSLRSEEDEEDEEEEDGHGGGAGGKTELKRKQGEQTERGGESGRAETVEQQTAPTLSTLLVQCKCGDGEVKVSINTGCQHNHISSTCSRRLGLKASPDRKARCESTANTVMPVHLQFGKQRVQCTAQVVDEAFDLCLGLQTLLDLKCCVDLNTRVLRLHNSGEELPFLETPACSRCHRHDSNKNL